MATSLCLRFGNNAAQQVFGATIETMATLFITNLPQDCSDTELQQWLETRGLQAEWLKVVHDWIQDSQSAFAYVIIEETPKVQQQMRLIDGDTLNGRIISVRKTPFQACVTAKTSNGMK